jgi:hypothetical protein
MSNLVNRSRRTHQRNRQSRRVNRNSSRRQKGGAPTEYSIYFNYIVENRRDIYNNNGKIYTTKINIEQEHAMFDSFDTVKRNVDDGIKYQNINLVSLKQLDMSYSSASLFGVYYHFVLNIIDTQSLPYEQLKNLLKDFMDDTNDFETLEFSQWDKLNDNNDYKVDNKYYEIVQGGSTSVTPPTPTTPTQVNESEPAQLPPPTQVNESVPAQLPPPTQVNVSEPAQPPLPIQVNVSVPARQSVNVPKKRVKSIQKVSNNKRNCVQKNYNIKTKRGSRYSVTRCILSYDPNVNDTDNCKWNKPTDRCRKVSRR